MNLYLKQFLHCHVKSKIIMTTMLFFLCNIFLLHATVLSEDNASVKGDNAPFENNFPAGLMQNIAVTGTVLDNYGETMPGVNITVKGTQIGTISGANGEFSINIPNNEAILVFSYIGFATKEVLVGSQRQLNVTLIEDTRQMDEVVVVGYGTQKKVNMTGSVSSVDLSKMDNRPIVSLSAGLAGMASGISVTQGNGGRPGHDQGTIRIRGQGTLNNSDPLVIIDGTVGDMKDLNPQDVESISILKDAASSAIYGSRAANGVILITTRKGREGSSSVTYNGYVTAQKLPTKLNIVSNYADYMELFNEGLKNSGQALQFSQAKIDEWRKAGNSDPVKYPNTDWQDEAFGRGWMQNHTVSINGGTQKVRYFVSGNFLDNPGIMENSGYQRISARANLDVDVNSWIKVGVNSYGYRAVADLGLDDDNRFPYIIGTTPGMCYRAPDGRYGGVNNTEDDVQAANNNILRALNSMKGDRKTNKINARFYGIITPFKGLSIEGSFTYDFSNTYRYQQPVFNDIWNLYDNTIQTSGTGRTSVVNADEKWIRNQMDGVIRYETAISDLNIQAMIGASQESYRYHWFTASRLDLTAPELTELNAATMDPSATGNYTNWAMRSTFGRLALNWAEKYLLEANLRMDLSSRFAPGSYRRGVFPSFSAGWRASEEGFMHDISWLDNLKIRASYGALGNNSLGSNRDNDGNYSYQALYAASNYVLNNGVQIGFAQTALSNAILAWESTYVTNVGVDFGFLRTRLNGSAEFFVKNTKDILIDLPAPLVHGNASIPKQNAGEVRNTGIELNLEWNDRIGDVHYFVGGNFTYVKNKLTKFKGDEPSYSGVNTLLEGKPINIQYVMAVDRLVQTDADLAYVQSLVDKNPDAFKNYKRPEKGDLLYKDTDGDGIITSDDRIYVGNGDNPTTYYGFTFGASWKGFDFSCMLQGSAGNNIYWSGGDAAAFWPVVRRGNQMNKTITDGRWYEGRTDAKYPRLLEYNDTRNTVASDFWMQDKSYLKVKNIQLGYTIPRNITQKLLVEKFHIYASIDNALTFTKYQGLDPEVSGTKYPTLRMTTFGINLTF